MRKKLTNLSQNSKQKKKPCYLAFDFGPPYKIELAKARSTAYSGAGIMLFHAALSLFLRKARAKVTIEVT